MNKEHIGWLIILNWGWMLLQIIQLGELIKQEVPTNKNAVENHTLGYFMITF